MTRSTEPGDGARPRRRLTPRRDVWSAAYQPRREEWSSTFDADPDGPPTRTRRVMRVVGPSMGVVWAVFLLQPAQVAAKHPDPVVRWVSLVAIVLLALTFAWVVVRNRPLDDPVPRRTAWLVLGVQVVLVAISTLGAHTEGLGGLVFVCVSAVFLLREPRVLLLPIIASVIVLVVPPLVGWDAENGIIMSLLLATLAVYGFVQLVERNRQLRVARDEVAVLAVERERERIARDMHDILGHSLTVISVKAELASRMFDVDADRARAEIVEVNALARAALADVRAMVTATRAVTLAGELAGARQAFDSAGIAADVPGSIEQVPDDLRQLFAWAIREGTTNVLRHSDATRVRVTMTADTLTFDDDGQGLRTDPASGNGLRGLTERARAAGAHVAVSRSPLGGYRLQISTAPAAPAAPLTPGTPTA
ncbi:sensor histidine kinase [Cellulomonas alba]|uniref:Sensor histidine kinase n=1 Tax=Cellulomonas alba TaxID=3053467 RepID=A0ABT7SC30_9CELL|nr:sensor histidine kinase [Cellulomonas alba]MDM7853746.1 sensor histidine kinase [Cellulomonas alba]